MTYEERVLRLFFLGNGRYKHQCSIIGGDQFSLSSSCQWQLEKAAAAACYTSTLS